MEYQPPTALPASPSGETYSNIPKFKRDVVAITEEKDLKGPEEKGVPPGHEVRTQRPFQEIRLPLLATLLTSAVFSVTAWFATVTFSSQSTSLAQHAFKKVFKIDVGVTLTVLRILQGILTGCTTYVLLAAFQLIQWTLVARENGANGLTVLALSPTTSVFGTLCMLFTSKPRMIDRVWALSRSLLFVSVWLSGVLLFIKTSLVTSYNPVYLYDVTAGVGRFNASSVPEYLEFLQSLTPEYNKTVVPYSIYSMVQGLVVNKMHSVASPSVNCGDRVCDSYLFTGGLIMTTPLPPTSFPEYPVIQVHDAPTTQLEFSRGLEGNDSFEDGDCSVFGAEGYLIAIRLCVAHSRADAGAITAGLYVCPNGTSDGNCLSDNNHYPNITTTFSVYSRTASFIVSRSNFSILSVSQISPPAHIVDTNINAIRQALHWLLDYSSAGIPATTSIAQHFWSAQGQLENDLWSIEFYQVFQSILAFPFWHFNPNNYGNTQLTTNEIASNLPREFYTTAAIVSPNTQIRVNKTTFTIFALLEGLIITFVWLALLATWLIAKRLPEISSYPLLDFSLKTELEHSHGSRTVSNVTRSFLQTSDSATRAQARALRVKLRRN